MLLITITVAKENETEIFEITTLREDPRRLHHKNKYFPLDLVNTAEEKKILMKEDRIGRRVETTSKGSRAEEWRRENMYRR